VVGTGGDGRPSRYFGLKPRLPLPITGAVSIQSTLARVSAIRQEIADPAALVSSTGSTGGTAAPAQAGEGTFAQALSAAAAGTQEGAAPGMQAAYSPYQYGVQGAGSVTGSQLGASSSPGARIVAIAEGQLGQAVQPPGSGESPAIAQYRSATAGSIPGAPWCAYFASWVAQQAGEPLGAGGQGLGAVSEVWSWAQSTGRAVPNGPGVVPKPGDLIVFGSEHVGIVRDVLPNGQIQTIEGNYENKVAANVRSPTEATGYVSMS
jgi:hypothetical protein